MGFDAYNTHWTRPSVHIYIHRPPGCDVMMRRHSKTPSCVNPLFGSHNSVCVCVIWGKRVSAIPMKQRSRAPASHAVSIRAIQKYIPCLYWPTHTSHIQPYMREINAKCSFGIGFLMFMLVSSDTIYTPWPRNFTRKTSPRSLPYKKKSISERTTPVSTSLQLEHECHRAFSPHTSNNHLDNANVRMHTHIRETHAFIQHNISFKCPTSRIKYIIYIVSPTYSRCDIIVRTILRDSAEQYI